MQGRVTILFNFWKSHRTVFHSSILHSHRQRPRVYNFSTSEPTLFFKFYFWMIAIPVGIEWHLTTFKGRLTRLVRIFFFFFAPCTFWEPVASPFIFEKASPLRAECPGTRDSSRYVGELSPPNTASVLSKLRSVAILQVP